MMRSIVRNVLAVSVSGLVLVGCNRSNPPAAGPPQPVAVEEGQTPPRPVAADKGPVNPQSTPPQSTIADPDRRAAEWVLRVDGSVRAVVDGVPREIKKGEKLPDGAVKLLAIDLHNCPKATDDGREHLRGLRGLQELAINSGGKVRNLDFLSDLTGLQVLNSEGGSPLITDKDLVHIQGMTNLKTLVIVSQFNTNPDLTDKALAVARELKQLERLRLCNCNISDGGVRQLDGHGSLRSVDFWRTKVGDAGLMALASLPKLENAYVKETQVTDAGVKAFQAKAPKVRVTK